jgi:hypothetical protein
MLYLMLQLHAYYICNNIKKRNIMAEIIDRKSLKSTSQKGVSATSKRSNVKSFGLSFGKGSISGTKSGSKSKDEKPGGGKVPPKGGGKVPPKQDGKTPPSDKKKP